MHISFGISQWTCHIFETIIILFAQTTQNTIHGNENNIGQGDKSPTSTAKAHHDDPSNSYGSLNKTGDHTYASINKPGSGKNSNSSGEKHNNTAHIAMTAPVPTGGSGRSAGGDGKGTGDGSSDLNSTRGDNGGEVRKM